MNIALFDFDGTITNRDMFTDFLYFAISKKRLFFGKVILAPQIVAYKLGILSGSKIRQKIVRVGFFGRDKKDLINIAENFSKNEIDKFLRTNAMDKLNWHKAQGDKIVIVSASLDLYLKDWCNRHGVDLICSRLEAKNNRFTGRYLGKDCSAEQKARLIKDKYDLSKFKKVYAYGDTKEDLAMLELADESYYRWELMS